MTMKTEPKVTISKKEYKRLKSLEHKFQGIISYAKEVESINEAREDIKKGKVVEQKDLFDKLGL